MQSNNDPNNMTGMNPNSYSAINLTSGLDYKELQKTLVQFQKA